MAGSERRLTEYEGFEDLIRAAADHHRLRPALVFKDYWVTRVLQAIATDPGHEGRVVFKGGTSLSKGWKLIDRFSEDIDLLLTGPAFGPMPSSRGQRRTGLKALQASIERATPLRIPDLATMTRDDREFFYDRGDKYIKLRYALPGRASQPYGPGEDWVLVEAGYRGGPHPHLRRPLRSLIAEYLDTQPIAQSALADYGVNLSSFEMELLKPERTFAEKLLALHVHMVDGILGAGRVRTRHYYDVVQLYAKSEDVRACLDAGGLRDLVRDAARIIDSGSANGTRGSHAGCR